MAKRKAKKSGKKEETDDPLERTVSEIQADFGEGAIMRLGDDFAADVDAISTGALSLDFALGVGGIPRGRVTEVFGPESSGKTTLALTVSANAQKLGGIVAFIDAEHALDPAYMRKLGVNLDDLLVSQPDHGEQALDIAIRLVKSNAVDVVVIDSVAALVPKEELDGEMGKIQVGLQARLMSKALRKLAGIIHKTRTSVIFINQIRMKIGVMWGSPETTPGGRALKFYASVRIDIRRIGSLKEGETRTANVTRARVVKNKVAPPFRSAEFDIIFGEGISWEGTLIDLGVEYKVVEKAGAWFSYKGTRLGQGREQARQFLIENKDVAEVVEKEIRHAHAGETGLADDTEDEEAGTDDSGKAGEGAAEDPGKA